MSRLRMRTLSALLMKFAVGSSVVFGVAAASALGGCAAQGETGGQGEPLSADQAFVSVPRPATAASLATTKALHSKAVPTAGADESFYIAINRKELGKRWFLSAFLKQYFPGAVNYGAASSLGTKVVTFRVQNGKLFVFDASDGHASSDTFDPELIIDAYPIVADASFGKRPGADGFVLFDPAAGLNHFGVVSDAFATPDNTAPSRFSVELSFLQNYRSIADGVTFEQVFTGYSDTADSGAGSFTEGNQFHGAGTLGIALRRYVEGTGFTKATLPWGGEYFFRNGSQLVKNTGRVTDFPIKWNIHPGMKPIQWVISDKLKTYVDAHFPGSDIVGAVQRGIEGWNGVFGYKVLEAHVGTAGDGPDDDVNYLYFDEDPSVGYAFANWRTNPNTGEIRGTSIYFNAVWLDPSWFTDDPAPAGGAPKAPRAPKAAPKSASIVWDGMPSSTLCAFPAPAYHGQQLGKHGDDKLTGQQKLERLVQHTILHEVGHTLGLRHNFAGSLGKSAVEPSTSVMDYLLDDDGIAMPTPGSYDIAALKMLYQAGPTPTARFCTDEQTSQDPDCTRFDQGNDPLNDYWGPSYKDLLSYADGMGGIPPYYVPYYVDPVLQYVRASYLQSGNAWSIATGGIATPLDPASTTQHQAAADSIERLLFTRLYLEKPENRGPFKMDPFAYLSAVPSITSELGNVLGNTDHVRTFASRRVAVDVLKKMQTPEAYQALLGARDAIVAIRPSLSGVEAGNTDDLLARIDVAIHPYFAK